jgi:hypothetical protein
MAQPIVPVSDSMKQYRIKYNELVNEVNGISSINSVTSDSGTITVGSGQTNRNIGVRGSTNISTQSSGTSIQISTVDSPTFTGVTSTGTTNLTGNTNITNANITNLDVVGV